MPVDCVWGRGDGGGGLDVLSDLFHYDCCCGRRRAVMRVVVAVSATIAILIGSVSMPLL